jgi:hypothetical protein
MSESPPSKFPRHKPQANVEQAEKVLFEEMEQAAELLQSKDDFGRSGVRHAVHACYSFLHVLGLSGQALKPPIDVITAFESVDHGNLPELFDPKLKPAAVPERKWSRSAAANEVKIHAAACMDALMNNGIGKDEAAARVARHSNNWPRVSQGLIKPNTVANSRDELLQKRSDDRERKRFEKRSGILLTGKSPANIPKKPFALGRF